MLLSDPRRSNITTAALSTLNAPSSTLCFHARHIPSISIEAYLLRILKYCPTTNDVFLSLLVYFDRMSRVGATGSFPGEPLGGAGDKHQADDDMEEEGSSVNFPGIRGFAIDSYNVHRLVIAGITVASKFFSDVFYTNARYAKVGGLAVHELNQLELHFLLLTDFRLTIPVSEIQQYGDQLLAYASDRSAAQHIARPLGAPDHPTNEAESSA
ncbi:cyclin-like protein interacting with PHO85 [Malassezia obtusa]|uniref:Cyclin n=1 Tax=Malassezia obtusa TaxID=76774 RepID=A0AAF0DZ73_9BASI|nr:cyclin-like protein interacting with PHO85 [Malassezia obtusa]